MLPRAGSSSNPRLFSVKQRSVPVDLMTEISSAAYRKQAKDLASASLSFAAKGRTKQTQLEFAAATLFIYRSIQAQLEAIAALEKITHLQRTTADVEELQQLHTHLPFIYEQLAILHYNWAEQAYNQANYLEALDNYQKYVRNIEQANSLLSPAHSPENQSIANDYRHWLGSKGYSKIGRCHLQLPCPYYEEEPQALVDSLEAYQKAVDLLETVSPEPQQGLNPEFDLNFNKQELARVTQILALRKERIANEQRAAEMTIHSLARKLAANLDLSASERKALAEARVYSARYYQAKAAPYQKEGIKKLNEHKYEEAVEALAASLFLFSEAQDNWDLIPQSHQTADHLAEACYFTRVRASIYRTIAAAREGFAAELHDPDEQKEIYLLAIEDYDKAMRLTRELPLEHNGEPPPEALVTTAFQEMNEIFDYPGLIPCCEIEKAWCQEKLAKLTAEPASPSVSMNAHSAPASPSPSPSPSSSASPLLKGSPMKRQESFWSQSTDCSTVSTGTTNTPAKVALSEEQVPLLIL